MDPNARALSFGRTARRDARLAGWWGLVLLDRIAGRSAMAEGNPSPMPWPIDRRERRQRSDRRRNGAPNRPSLGALDLPGSDRPTSLGANQSQDETVPHGSPHLPRPGRGGEPRRGYRTRPASVTPPSAGQRRRLFEAPAAPARPAAAAALLWWLSIFLSTVTRAHELISHLVSRVVISAPSRRSQPRINRANKKIGGASSHSAS